MKKIVVGTQDEFLRGLFFGKDRDVTGNEFGPNLCCPVCKSYNVHFSGAKNIDGHDNYVAWQGRGDAIIIGMFCEGGHSWILRFGFHKGLTYVAVEDVEELMNDD